MNPFDGQGQPEGRPTGETQTGSPQPAGAGQPAYPQPQPYPQQPFPQQPYPPEYQQQYGQQYPPAAYPPQYPQGYPQPGYAPTGYQVPVQPVALPSRSHRFRWAIAGAVVLTVALVTAAGAFVLSGASGSKSLTASMAPKGSTVFVELRTDLPGDQHQKLADFMSHFPGFADRAQFDNALDELFNRITSSISPDLAYTSAFKPWMEGEVSIAVLPGTSTATPRIPIPSGIALPSDLSGLLGESMGMYPYGMTSGFGSQDAVVIVQLKDRAAAQSWVSSELSKIHVTATSQTYAGETLYTLSSSGEQGAYAITNSALIGGTTAGVKASLDARSKGSLADDANYQAAMKSLSGDSLARFYMNPRSLIGPLMGSLNMMGASPSGLSLDKVPTWMAGSLRAESDRMVVEATSSAASSGVSNHNSQIAPNLPGSTVAVFEAHSVGQQISKALDTLSSMGPSLGMESSQIKQVQDALALIGGIDWLKDVAVAVTDDNGTFGGGLVVQTPDATTAKSKLAMLTNFVALAGGSTGLKSTTETYKGQTITVITVPETSSPFAGGELRTDAIAIGLTTKDNLIVAGYQDTFAKAVIDTTSSNALSAQSDYNAVMNAVGASNQASFYLNVPALEDQLGRMATSSSNWNTNYKPYFDHLGGIGYASIDGSTSMVRFVLMAR